jgi:hypothetical protein
MLQRNQANSNPTSTTLDIVPGETAVLDDVISSLFGQATFQAAFRITSPQPVVVNGAILNLAGGQEFAQSFEGVPAGLATTSSSDSLVVGIKNNADYRANIYLIDATGSGSNVTLELLDTSGSVIDTANRALRNWEPILPSLDSVFGATVDDASMRITVTNGAVIGGVSRVNSGTGDPLTLAASTSASGATSPDGTYQFVVYDEGFGFGGNLVVSGGQVIDINGTYSNFQKLDGTETACKLTFSFGSSFTVPTDVADFETGVSFTDSFPAEDNSYTGQVMFTMEFTLTENVSIEGTIDAVGAAFEDIDTGCNGVFPQLDLFGGKSN